MKEVETISSEESNSIEMGVGLITSEDSNTPVKVQEREGYTSSRENDGLNR